jgi:hypothetical protein
VDALGRGSEGGVFLRRSVVEGVSPESKTPKTSRLGRNGRGRSCVPDIRPVVVKTCYIAYAQPSILAGCLCQVNVTSSQWGSNGKRRPVRCLGPNSTRSAS